MSCGKCKECSCDQLAKVKELLSFTDVAICCDVDISININVKAKSDDDALITFNDGFVFTVANARSSTIRGNTILYDFCELDGHDVEYDIDCYKSAITS